MIYSIKEAEAIQTLIYSVKEAEDIQTLAAILGCTG